MFVGFEGWDDWEVTVPFEDLSGYLRNDHDQGIDSKMVRYDFQKRICEKKSSENQNDQ